jgi:cell division protein FtsZ
VIAKAARDRGILTVGVVTKPFSFEGNRRMKAAEAGIEELQKHVDTLIVIPNQNLFLIANPNTTFKEAFQMADEVLQQGVRGITDLMVMPGLINLDFADVRSGDGRDGQGDDGHRRSVGRQSRDRGGRKGDRQPAARRRQHEGRQGRHRVDHRRRGHAPDGSRRGREPHRELVDDDANIIWGSAFNNDLDGKIRVSVVATGIEAEPSDDGRARQDVRLHQPAHRSATARAAQRAGGREGCCAGAGPCRCADRDHNHDLQDRGCTGGSGDRRAGAEGDELLLGADTELTPPVSGNPLPPTDEGTETEGGSSRRWLNEAGAAPATPAPRAGREGGTLFERMSNIARGAAKVPTRSPLRTARAIRSTFRAS